MENLKNSKNISIQTLIIISFIIIILTTSLLIGYIIFKGWLGLADRSIKQTLSHVDKEILSQVNQFIDIPIHLLEVNKELISQGVIDLNDQNQRESFFTSVLANHSQDIIYSFSFGSSNGNYYGARRNLSNKIEIMRNNQATAGHSWYYSVDNNFRAAKKTVDAGQFDPRTRAWYKRAIDNDQIGFSEIYKHFVMDDLTVSTSTAIYNKQGGLQGVLGAHIVLREINKMLKKISDEEQTETIIVEKNSGKLVGNSFNLVNFKNLNDNDFTRINIKEINKPILTKAYSEYLTQNRPGFDYYFRNQKFYLSVIPFNRNGLDWLIISSIPVSIFSNAIYHRMKLAGLLILISLLTSITIYLYLTNRFLNPINQLIEVTEDFSAGKLSQRAEITGSDEIARLAISFNNMAATINNLINNLEEKVAERTVELEQSNDALKDNIEEISYISYHDSLTGLYNRKYFEKQLKEKDKQENLPIAIIFADLNGLKLTNDIFGHDAGDELLIKAAQILKNFCRSGNDRSEDIVARVGGDEFAVLLTKTELKVANSIIDRIKKQFNQEKIRAVKASIAMGCDVKDHIFQNLERIMDNAEHEMYKNKTLNRKKVNHQMIETIMDTLHNRSSREREHSLFVSQLAVRLGRKLGLNQGKLKQLKVAAFMHDIGKIVLKSDLLEKISDLNEEKGLTFLSEEEKKSVEEHPVIGYRILNLFDETVELADIILSHHENWDGSGYPRGLKGGEIPVMAMVIKLAENMNWTLNFTDEEKSYAEIAAEYKADAGKRYDPELVAIFLEVIKEAYFFKSNEE